MIRSNTMMVERYRVISDKPIPAGNHTIEVKTRLEKPRAPPIITILLDGVESARLDVNCAVPLAFTASEPPTSELISVRQYQSSASTNDHSHSRENLRASRLS